MMLRLLIACCASALWFISPSCHAFVNQSTKTPPFGMKTRLKLASSSSPPNLSAQQKRRRSDLLKRDGPYFTLERFSGKVEFGATVNLVTRLPNADPDIIARWLSDERRVALSIWDENLMKEKGNSVFELKVMTLQFVTIRLAPSVDLKAWTTERGREQLDPLFCLQSVAFDPNIEILPGIGVSAKDLGVHIDVVGELFPTKGNVSGRIAFRSSGLLPPPMRLLPEPVLKGACDVINQTVTRFAIKNFQKGAVASYREFAQLQRQQQQKQQQQQIVGADKQRSSKD